MIYTLVQLHNFPVILFAHYFGPSDYSISRVAESEHYEITFISNGAINKRQGNKCITIPEYSVQVSLPGEKYEQSSSEKHSHSTCGIVVKSKKRVISKNEVIDIIRKKSQSTPLHTLDKGVFPEFILPDCVPPGKNADKIRNMLSDIIHSYQTSDSFYRQNIITIKILDLFAFLTSICIEDAEDSQANSLIPIHHQYVRKFKQYVQEHIDEDISCEKIAESLAITPGYLSAVVKKTTGETMIHYINRVKLEKIVELRLLYYISLKQAGEMVGINDSHYLSRLFKKYYGLSWREYKESRILQ